MDETADNVRFVVRVLAQDGLSYAYLWQLQRVADGPQANHWMTVGVSAPRAGSASQAAAIKPLPAGLTPASVLTEDSHDRAVGMSDKFITSKLAAYLALPGNRHLLQVIAAMAILSFSDNLVLTVMPPASLASICWCVQ